MKCCEWQDTILTDYLDDQMDKEQMAHLEKHLSICQECREFAAHARKAVIEPFEHAHRAEPSQEVWRNIKEAIAEGKEVVEFVSLWDRIRAIVFIPRPAMALATTVIVLITVMVTFNHYNQQFQSTRRAVIQSQEDDIDYALDELASYSEENGFYELTGIEEYFL